MPFPVVRNLGADIHALTSPVPSSNTCKRTANGFVRHPSEYKHLRVVGASRSMESRDSFPPRDRVKEIVQRGGYEVIRRGLASASSI